MRSIIIILLISLNIFLFFYVAEKALEYKIAKESPVSIGVIYIPEEKRINDILIYKINSNVDFSIEYSKRSFSFNNRQLIKRLMYIGEKEYRIPHQDILAIIFVESFWNPNVKNHNKNKSIDYGITQTNSYYMKERFQAAANTLDKYHIKYNIKNQYDLSLNIMSAFVTFNDNRNSLNILNEYNYFNQITSYNVGVNGCLKKKYLADRYYNKFIDYKVLFY